ncbi:MAG: transposase [Bacteroidota bacterium]
MFVTQNSSCLDSIIFLDKFLNDPTLNTDPQILFKEFPDIQKAYQLTCGLSDIYNRNIEKGVALAKMARWFNEIELSGFKSFATIRRTFEMHYPNILNFFENRSTNAFAESFNAKIKDFRRNFRGVCDSKFFLFRLNNIFG